MEPKPRVELGAFFVPGRRSTRLSYNGMAPTTRLERATSTSGGSRSPIELRQHLLSSVLGRGRTDNLRLRRALLESIELPGQIRGRSTN